MASKRKRQENIPYQVEQPQRKRISHIAFKSWLGIWQELASIISLFLALEIAVWSIEKAQWITLQASLTSVLTLAVLTGWLLCKSRLSNTITYPLALVLGAMVTVWLASNLLPPMEMAPRVSQLIAALQSWWQATTAAEPSEATIHFAVFLIFFTWIIGYVSTWFILRRQNPWVAISLGTIIILINLNYLPKQYYVFSLFYFLAVLLLVGQTNLAGYCSWFKKHGISYPYRGIVYFIASLLCLSILAVFISSLMPEIRFNRAQALVSTKMSWTKNVEEYFTKFLAEVPAKLPSLRSNQQRELHFGDPSWKPSNETHFVIASERPYYWRTQMYDVYTSRGWASSNSTEQLTGQEITSTEAGSLSKSNEISYTVRTALKTDILLTVGEFISARNLDVIRIQMGVGDTIAIITPYLLKPGQSYTVTSNVPSATSANLSNASDDYPHQITDYYLQLPPNLPERVRQLSENVTKEAKSSYDKVLAIKQYLSQIDYNLQVEAPPQEVDGVDYFLFTQKSGNCFYFASAMTIMLRSVGVPSRLSVGYLPGEWDTATGSSTVQAKHYHAWPAVYFPGYGWVEFEAVPTGGSEPEIELLSFGRDWEEWIIFEDMWLDWEDKLVGEYNSADTDSNKWLALTLTYVITGIVLAIFALRLYVSRWLRHFTGPDYASNIYGKMCFLASLVKLGPKLQQTPLEYSTKLASVFPLHREALGNIVRAYLESRFSQRKQLGLLEQLALRKSWHEVSHILLKRLFHIWY